MVNVQLPKVGLVSAGAEIKHAKRGASQDNVITEL